MKNTGKLDFRCEKSACNSRRIDSGYIVKGEVWMEKDGRIFLDSNRINLLCLIDKYGSLADAASFMGLGYNSAWLWIMDMNRLSPQPLVKRGSGGVNGGYSLLTGHGHPVIHEYYKLNCKFKKVAIDSARANLSIEFPAREQIAPSLEFSHSS
jgi:molybdate transport repressor ModE-like protein